jgi:hypothetical protein
LWAAVRVLCCLYTLQSHAPKVLGYEVLRTANTTVTASSANILGLVLINMHVFIVAVSVDMSIDTNLIYFAVRSMFR